MMTVRELREILNDPALDADLPVLLAENPPDEDGWLLALGTYAETRVFTEGPRSGARVPYDDQTDEYDEEDGEDSAPMLVLYPQAQGG